MLDKSDSGYCLALLLKLAQEFQHHGYIYRGLDCVPFTSKADIAIRSIQKVPVLGDKLLNLSGLSLNQI